MILCTTPGCQTTAGCQCGMATGRPPITIPIRMASDRARYLSVPAMKLVVASGWARLQPVMLTDGSVVDAYVPTEEGRRSWFGPLPPT